MKKTIFSRNTAPAAFNKQIQQNTNLSNFKRVTYFFAAMLIIEPFLIIFNDISGLLKGPYETYVYVAYLLIHTILLLISVFWVIFNKKMLKKCAHWNALVPVTVSIILILLSIINGLDQLHHDSINVYITYLLMACVALLYAFPTNLYVLLPPYLVFVITLFIFQRNEAAPL